MTFPDADGQPCDALGDCRRSDKAIPASSVYSATARRESGDCERYISSAAWQTSPARVAELRDAGRRLPAVLRLGRGGATRGASSHLPQLRLRAC
jgi:hypothetical protein